MTKYSSQRLFTIQICCAVIVSVTIICASFLTGKLVGNTAANPTKFTTIAQQQGLALDLSKATARLEMAETTNKLNIEALEQTRQTIVQLEQQVYQQQKQIIAYQAILSKQKPNSNLVIRDLIVQATSKPHVFKYKLALTRTDPANVLLKGQLQIMIEGISQGKTKILPLTQVSILEEHKQTISFSFRYMTLIPENNQFAEMNLPTNFIPKKVKITAYVSTNNKPTTKEFKWSVNPLPAVHQPL